MFYLQYLYEEGKSMSENDDTVRGGFLNNAHSGCSNDNDNFIWIIIIVIILFCCFCGNKHHDC